MLIDAAPAPGSTGVPKLSLAASQLDAGATTGGVQKFPRAASFWMSFPKIRSEAAFPSRLSSFSWSASSPQYCFRQRRKVFLVMRSLRIASTLALRTHQAAEASALFPLACFNCSPFSVFRFLDMTVDQSRWDISILVFYCTRSESPGRCGRGDTLDQNGRRSEKAARRRNGDFLLFLVHFLSDFRKKLS